MSSSSLKLNRIWKFKKGTTKVITIHEINGFEIKSIDADFEFNYLKTHLPILINNINKNSHMHRAERSISTFKERYCCTVQSLPFSYFPAPLIVTIIYNVVSNLNIFHRKIVFVIISLLLVLLLEQLILIIIIWFW